MDTQSFVLGLASPQRHERNAPGQEDHYYRRHAPGLAARRLSPLARLMAGIGMIGAIVDRVAG
jgi:hypothetical protein